MQLQANRQQKGVPDGIKAQDRRQIEAQRSVE